jgi:hypothetical protein
MQLVYHPCRICNSRCVPQQLPQISVFRVGYPDPWKTIFHPRVREKQKATGPYGGTHDINACNFQDLWTAILSISVIAPHR